MDDSAGYDFRAAPIKCCNCSAPHDSKTFGFLVVGVSEGAEELETKANEHRGARKFIKGINSVISYIEVIVLLSLLIFGIYAIWDNTQIDNENTASEYEMYKPTAKDTRTYDDFRKVNPDVCGWLTVNDTGIDYPLVHGEDNDEYMNKTADLQFALSGSLFLNYLNQPDFSDRNTIIYGHHMEGPSMFGVLDQYVKEDFFNSHEDGLLYYEGQWHELDIFAFLEVDAYDQEIYSIAEDDASYAEYLEYIRANAAQYLDVGVTTQDHIIVMSTCMTDKTNGRYIVTAKIGGVTDGPQSEETERSYARDGLSPQTLNLIFACIGGLIIFLLILIYLLYRRHKRKKEQARRAAMEMQEAPGEINLQTYDSDAPNVPGAQTHNPETTNAQTYNKEETLDFAEKIKTGSPDTDKKMGTGIREKASAASLEKEQIVAKPESTVPVKSAAAAASAGAGGVDLTRRGRRKARKARKQAGKNYARISQDMVNAEIVTDSVGRMDYRNAEDAVSRDDHQKNSYENERSSENKMGYENEMKYAEVAGAVSEYSYNEKKKQGRKGRRSAKNPEQGGTGAPVRGDRPVQDNTPKKKKKGSLGSDLVNLLIRLAIIAAIIWVIFSFVFGLFINSGVAMEPSVQDRDIIIFYRLDNEYTANEAVVYEADGEERLGRIVARGGDTVEITEDGLKVNGYLQQDYKNTGETLAVQDGLEYPITLAEDEFFILGDNREESTDSRMFGPVRLDDIKGSVLTVLRRRDV